MDFTSIFDGKALTLEEFQAKTKNMKLADLSGGEYVAKGKFEDQQKKIGELEKQVSEKDTTIKKLEAAGGDADTVRKELEAYKKAEADRKKAEEDARADQILTAAAEQALEGREFVNDPTRAHYVAELKKAIADPANKGKSPAKLFEAMTKDADGIFKNPQQEPLKIPRVDNHPGKPMTREDIFKKDDKGRYVLDAAERQRAIAANLDQFTNNRKDE